MDRWSFKRRFGDITFEDFIGFVKQFSCSIGSHCEDSTKVTITLYGEVPITASIVHPDSEEMYRRDIQSKQFAILERISELTNELFEEAVFVVVDVHLEHEKVSKYLPGTFGKMSCKGSLPSHILFSLHPEELAEGVSQAIKPSRLQFAIGDGHEKNHLHSVHYL